MSMDERGPVPVTGSTGGALDVERDSDVPISTQIFWQLAYQIDSGRLLPGARLPPVRELGAALRVNPNTIRAVYRRLSDAGYVTSRHGAGTHVAERPPQTTRRPRPWPGIVAEMLRRAAHAGFTADEVAAATFAAATERKRPGPLVRVLYAECTNADAGYDAERLVDEFPGMIEAEGALLDDLPDRLERFHYDLVATTTFHADEAQTLAAGRVPVVAMLVGPGLRRARPRDRRAARRLAGRPRVRLGARRGQHPRDAGPVGHDAASRSCPRSSARRTTSSWSIGPPTSSSCRARRWRPGSTARSRAPDRIRPWTYDFDPSGLELLRRAIEHAAATAPPGRSGLAVEPPSEVLAT